MGSEKSELLEAQAHIWNHTFKYINSMSLKCAVELGIPDIIHSHGQPMRLSNLLAALHIIQPHKAQCLKRLMRLLVHSGFFSQIHGDNNDQEEEVKYALTPSSRYLLCRHNNDTTFETLPFLFLALHHQAMLAPWGVMSSWLLCSEDENYSTAFEMVNNGKSIWNYMVEEPDFGKLFHQAMVYDSKMIGRLVTRECPEVFEGLKSMVDVGGGEGIMAKAIVEAFPHITCTVFDLPQVVSNHQHQTTKNLNFIGGDMFKANIPPADALLLKVYIYVLDKIPF